MTKHFEITSTGKAKELNPFGNVPLESEEEENYLAALQQWQEAEENRKEYEVNEEESVKNWQKAFNIDDYMRAFIKFAIHCKLGAIVEGTLSDNKVTILKVIE